LVQGLGSSGIASVASSEAVRERVKSFARIARRANFRSCCTAYPKSFCASIRRRKPLLPYDIQAYRERNLIERMIGRLKDFRRVATRYDKLARNYLAGVLLAAIAIAWI
jgi:transposase